MKSILDTEKWKIHHGQVGSNISVPYEYKGKIEDGWVIGPLNKDVANWLYNAIEEKQKRQINPLK